MALLDLADITKRFPGVVALDGARLSVASGEVHALLGENGAGKSTLLKILSGAQACDSGRLTFDGAALSASDTPVQRQRAGIVTIYQEFNLQPFLTVAENLYLGREPLRFGLIDHKRLRADARAVLDGLGLDLDPDMEVRRLNIADQQMVEIARAMTLQAKLIVMDEPTAALSPREVDILHRIIGELKARGIAVIYVTHRLKEVKTICDGYTVLRDGRFVATGRVAEIEVAGMVRLMVGRDVEFLQRPPHREPAEIVLKVDGVSRKRGRHEARGTSLTDVSFEVRAGEIVGLAGLVGAGRTDLVRVLFGADAMDSGTITLNGEVVNPASPCDALKAGIALVPEDRKQQGCFLEHSIRHNLSLPSLKRLSRWGIFVDETAEKALVEDFRTRLNIRMAHDGVAIATLSGGNQQKVLLARCMALSPKVLIVDEPTRGVDVGAKADVHQVLFDMAATGVAVIVVSSELPEVMAVSDRIIVFREGRIAGTLDGFAADEETLMGLMATGRAA
ncbi:ABC transporter family protein [Asticcacaulis biprosthecium C19]|uniref:ABC transporter family protein n=1 Tax=Asticcacaulis biprosthecium C19 TaxID=715226 RepID=F4QU97_9CAUL|nr:sugar ABC transporter ATP-binding protein [Asticcacaulis biprosthecium]EGF89397.1 ABC transporter family protein [Asticcacaulis biprosthecium C19]